MRADPAPDKSAAREGRFALGGAELYYRDIGRGTPIVALHGGPDFDHQYLLPDLDRLADSCRLIYYAQRGRGASLGHVQPADVTLASEIEDLDALRAHLGLPSVALLGHSWGGVLAMEYAIRHPERTSHLTLVNTGPASHNDYKFLGAERRRTAPRDMERLVAMSSTPEYRAGDLEADAAYYRIHFGATLRSPEQLEQLVRSLRASASSSSADRGTSPISKPRMRCARPSSNSWPDARSPKVTSESAPAGWMAPFKALQPPTQGPSAPPSVIGNSGIDASAARQ